MTMAKRPSSAELQDVPLTTRFRKMNTDKKAKVRQRAKVVVVPISSNGYGVTIKRGTVTVKKGTVEIADTTATKVRTQVERDVKAGHYDTALFEDYERIVGAKRKKKAMTA
jgi:hypothetical protein